MMEVLQMASHEYSYFLFLFGKQKLTKVHKHVIQLICQNMILIFTLAK
jgi:hypothetical protein